MYDVFATDLQNGKGKNLSDGATNAPILWRLETLERWFLISDLEMRQVVRPRQHVSQYDGKVRSPKIVIYDVMLEAFVEWNWTEKA